LLLRGRYGIHAVDAQHDTPYVSVYLRGEGLPGGGKLSPDGRWYAVLEGDSSESDNGKFAGISVKAIRVYDTRELHKTHSMQWKSEYGTGQGLWREIRWYDNDAIIYPGTFDGEEINYRIDPFEGRYEKIELPFDLPFDNAYPSPDWTRAVYDSDPYNTSQWHLNNGNGQIEMFPDEIYVSMAVYWTPDSKVFAAIRWEKTQYGVFLYDRDGNQLDTIAAPKETEKIDRDDAVWSPDSTNFAFLVSQNLMIADVKAKRIIDYCTSGSGLIWSPDSTKLAFMGNSIKQQRPIRVLDLEAEQVYTIAYHSGGSIIGWRAD
jgi:hypothetical protein